MWAFQLTLIMLVHSLSRCKRLLGFHLEAFSCLRAS